MFDLQVTLNASNQVSCQLAILIQEKKGKIDFQDGSHLTFLIGTIWLFLMYKSSPCFTLSFKSIGPLVQEKKRKIDFQDGCQGGPLGFSME